MCPCNSISSAIWIRNWWPVCSGVVLKSSERGCRRHISKPYDFIQSCTLSHSTIQSRSIRQECRHIAHVFELPRPKFRFLFFHIFFFDNLNSNTHDCIDIVVYLISIKQPQSPWTGVFLWWVYVRLPESGDVWNWQIDSLQFAHFFRQFYFFTSTNYKNHASAWIWLTKTVSQLPWIALTIRLAVTASSTQWETRSPNIYLIQCTHSDLSDRKITLKSKWAAVRRRFIVPKHLRTCENVYFAHHRPLLYC